MRSYLKYGLCLVSFCLSFPVPGLYGSPHGSHQEQANSSNAGTVSSPDSASTATIIELLDFKNADLRDVVRAIATKYGLNIFVEEGIDHRVTLHLIRIPIQQALQFIAKQYGLELEQDGTIFKFKKPEITEPEPTPLAIDYTDSLLSVDLKNDDLALVVDELSKNSGYNILLNQGVHGTVSGFLQGVPFHEGFDLLMRTNGFRVREQGQVFLVGRSYRGTTENGPAKGNGFWVAGADTLVNLDVTKADIRDVIKEIFLQLGMDVVFYQDVQGEITAR